MEVSTNSVMGTNGGRRTNKRWPEALKREIVAASLVPGSSVSIVARQYDVNANQVFIRSRCYEPLTGPIASPAPPAPRPRLVPVTIGLEPEGDASAPSAKGSADTITVEVAGTCLIRIGANCDDRALRCILDCLARARGARENNR